jgi:predicted NBD/HSP70 family sugar kinase
MAALRGSDRLSRAELAELTGLPKTTVAGVVGRLLHTGALVECPADGPEGPRRTGRPATALRLASAAGSVAVLSLTHGGLQVAVASFDGRLQARRDLPIGLMPAARGIVEPGLALLPDVLADAGLDAQAISCAVLSVPAPFERGRGARQWQASETAGKTAPERRALLRRLRPDPALELGLGLGVPAMADNDANLAALGETTFGIGRGLSDVVYLKIVEGVGAGLILDGRLYRGARGIAGELAHVQVDDDGPWCFCGGRGCLKGVVGPSVAAILQPAYQRSVTLEEIVTLAEQGDAGTRRILADAGRRFGRVLADMCVVLNPEAIVVDGLLGAAAEPFLAGVREMIDRHTPAIVADDVRLLTGSLGDRAEILGAVALAGRERLDEQPVPSAG